MRKRKLLKWDSVPSIFPNCPQLRIENSISDSLNLNENIEGWQGKRIQQLFAEERFHNLDEMKSQMAKEALPKNIVQLDYGKSVAFAKIDELELSGPAILFSLVLDKDLVFEMFCQGIKVENSMVSIITKKAFLRSVSQINSILSFLEHYHETEATSTNHVKNSVDALERLIDQSMDGGCSKIQSAIKQLRLAVYNTGPKRKRLSRNLGKSC